MRDRCENRQRGIVPDLIVASTGGDNFSKWFAIFLEKVGAKAPKMSFHSFRHNFVTPSEKPGYRNIPYALDEKSGPASSKMQTRASGRRTLGG